MNTLITAQQVVAMAFGGTNNLRAEEVCPSTILAAERTFLLPVFGATLLDQLREGSHPSLLALLQPALALYVKRLMLPSLAARVGMAGVVRYAPEGYTEADNNLLQRLQRRTKADADALVDQAVELVAASPDSYPSYSPAHNVRNRTRISAGVVL